MKRMLFAAALIASAGLFAVAGPPAEAQAYPQADFVGVPAPTIASNLAAKCMEGGFMVLEQSPTGVLCQRQLSGVQAAVTMFLLSNMHSTPPVQTVRFAIVPIGPDIFRVQGSAIVQSQMPYGQVRTAALDDPNASATIQQVLREIGGR